MTRLEEPAGGEGEHAESGGVATEQDAIASDGDLAGQRNDGLPAGVFGQGGDAHFAVAKNELRVAQRSEVDGGLGPHFGAGGEPAVDLVFAELELRGASAVQGSADLIDEGSEIAFVVVQPDSAGMTETTS